MSSRFVLRIFVYRLRWRVDRPSSQRPIRRRRRWWRGLLGRVSRRSRKRPSSRRKRWRASSGLHRRLFSDGRIPSPIVLSRILAWSIAARGKGSINRRKTVQRTTKTIRHNETRKKMKLEKGIWKKLKLRWYEWDVSVLGLFIGRAEEVYEEKRK